MEFSTDSTSPQKESFQPKEEDAMGEGPAGESGEDTHLQEESFSHGPEDEIYMENSPVVERAPAAVEETTVTNKAYEPSVTEWSPIAEGSPIGDGEGSPIVKESPDVEWSPISEKEPVLEGEAVEERASSPSIETPYYHVDTPPIAEKASPIIEKAPVIEEPLVVTMPTVVNKPFDLAMTPVEKRTYFMEAAPPVVEKVQPIVEKTPSPGKAHATEETHIVSKKPVMEKKATAEKKTPVVQKTQVVGKASATKETPFVNKVRVPIMQKVPVLLETTVSKMAPFVEKFRKEIRALQNYQEAPSAAEPAATMSVLFLFVLYITLFTLIFRLNASSVLLFLPRL
ncbi:hypothetical protein NEUTE1DRAFT_98691 [Neurospora tetrasperma FGSC 2508]|uniref:Uncharacterized protein n=1 Tax=Neurospora tetrasperma (strain FGSC 2508 / ATCC MYA-4615 / P0657) TaxID=510951 RepID=F8MEC5_NEUT8|nr:uncharacterized protein NEUTE1DRAFT_98691 [Neurospora tetrasperma FGSC 2508]EGO61607.1 hypothetical protein NEUTE1DRAFT_98691 [Neurospora tetrasperma FGSC 2508]EGZ74349.1 hypothetical protein NEUTE2DRAFT_55412 [Neurospora tetrasperma FGSC 2509]